MFKRIYPRSQVGGATCADEFSNYLHWRNVLHNLAIFSKYQLMIFFQCLVQDMSGRFSRVHAHKPSGNHTWLVNQGRGLGGEKTEDDLTIQTWDGDLSVHMQFVYFTAHICYAYAYTQAYTYRLRYRYGYGFRSGYGYRHMYNMYMCVYIYIHIQIYVFSVLRYDIHMCTLTVGS